MSASAWSRSGTMLSTRWSPVSSNTRRIWGSVLMTTRRPPFRSMRRIELVRAPRPEESRNDAFERSTTIQHWPRSRQVPSRCSRAGALHRSRSPVTETNTICSLNPSSVRVKGLRTAATILPQKVHRPDRSRPSSAFVVRPMAKRDDADRRNAPRAGAPAACGDARSCGPGHGDGDSRTRTPSAAGAAGSASRSPSWSTVSRELVARRHLGLELVDDRDGAGVGAAQHRPVDRDEVAEEHQREHARQRGLALALDDEGLPGGGRDELAGQGDAAPLARVQVGVVEEDGGERAEAVGAAPADDLVVVELGQLV